MIWLVLSIVLTSSLILFFKLFEKFNVNTLQALVANYFTAAFLGFIFSGIANKVSVLQNSEWLPFAIPLGLLFISIFYTVSVTAVKISVSAATVANKMSVVMPICAAVYFYHDKITPIKAAGIVLALFAVILTSAKKENDKKTNAGSLFYLPILIFIGSGLIDVIVNYVQTNFLKGNGSDLFLGTAFLTAGLTGGIIVSIQLAKGTKFEAKNVLWGIGLGIPNYFSIYTLIKALDSKQFESSVFFPVNNIGIVVLTALTAYLFFKEKLSYLNLTGIAIALVSIILIST